MPKIQSFFNSPACRAARLALVVFVGVPGLLFPVSLLSLVASFRREDGLAHTTPGRQAGGMDFETYVDIAALEPETGRSPTPRQRLLRAMVAARAVGRLHCLSVSCFRWPPTAVTQC